MPKTILTFESAGVAFKIMLLGSIDTRRHLMVWYRMKGQMAWNFGHARELSDVTDSRVAADIMRKYLTGELSPDQYKELLPEEVRK